MICHFLVICCDALTLMVSLRYPLAAFGKYSRRSYPTRKVLASLSLSLPFIILKSTNIIDIYTKLELLSRLILLCYYYCYWHFDCTLKSRTFGIPGLVLPGRRTAWCKSGHLRKSGWVNPIRQLFHIGSPETAYSTD